MPKKNTQTLTIRDYEVSASIDIELDASDLAADGWLHEDDLGENGYHHEDECSGPDVAADARNLRDWHDQNHGFNLFTACRNEPCMHLSEDFRDLAK